MHPERWTDDPHELYPTVDFSVVFIDADDRPLDEDERRQEIETHYSKYHS